MRLRATSACLSAALLAVGFALTGCSDPGVAPPLATGSQTDEGSDDETVETVTETVDEEESPTPPAPIRTVATGPVAGALTVIAPASLKGAMPGIVTGFQQANPSVKVTVSYLPAEQIAPQVAGGRAKADVVVAGSSNDLGQIFVKNLVAEPSIIARAPMAVVVPTKNAKVRKLGDLGGTGIILAMCAAEAGCGPAGAELLGKAKIAPQKVVRAPGAANVIDLVAKGRADAGIVSLVDARGNKAVSTLEVGQDLLSVQMTFLAAPMMATKNGGTATAFVSFLGSATYAALTKAGLLPN